MDKIENWKLDKIENWTKLKIFPDNPENITIYQTNKKIKILIKNIILSVIDVKNNEYCMNIKIKIADLCNH